MTYGSCWLQLRLPGAPDETLLRYAVEVQVPRDMRMLGMLEPMLERMAYEDIPVNLAALKQRVEDLRGSRVRQQRAADFEAQGETVYKPFKRCLPGHIHVMIMEKFHLNICRQQIMAQEAWSWHPPLSLGLQAHLLHIKVQPALKPRVRTFTGPPSAGRLGISGS